MTVPFANTFAQMMDVVERVRALAKDNVNQIIATERVLRNEGYVDVDKVRDADRDEYKDMAEVIVQDVEITHEERIMKIASEMFVQVPPLGESQVSIVQKFRAAKYIDFHQCFEFTLSDIGRILNGLPNLRIAIIPEPSDLGTGGGSKTLSLPKTLKGLRFEDVKDAQTLVENLHIISTSLVSLSIAEKMKALEPKQIDILRPEILRFLPALQMFSYSSLSVVHSIQLDNVGPDCAKLRVLRLPQSFVMFGTLTETSLDLSELVSFEAFEIDTHDADRDLDRIKVLVVHLPRLRVINARLNHILLAVMILDLDMSQQSLQHAPVILFLIAQQMLRGQKVETGSELTSIEAVTNIYLRTMAKSNTAPGMLDVPLQTLLASVIARLGKYREAVDMYTKIIDLAPAAPATMAFDPLLPKFLRAELVILGSVQVSRDLLERCKADMVECIKYGLPEAALFVSRCTRDPAKQVIAQMRLRFSFAASLAFANHFVHALLRKNESYEADVPVITM